MSLHPGCCLELPESRTLRHLYIVLTHPDGEPEKIVIVNLTSYRRGSDTTVVLEPGDHPYIRHKTVVNYKDARIAPVEPIERLLWRQDYELLEDFDAGLVGQLQQGLMDSPFTPNRVKTYCEGRF